MRYFLLATAAAVIATTGAHAALITNGSFETVGTQSFTSSPGGYQLNSTDLPGWTTSDSPTKYNYLLHPATATTTNPYSFDGSTDNRKLAAIPGASPDGGNFVALDGAPSYSAALSQTLTGLTTGKSYTVSFYWAGAQNDYNPVLPTTESLQVSFGALSQTTPVINVPAAGTRGWFSQSFSFVADNTSDVLSFLAIGSPDGVPPFALLDGVNVQAAPEPMSLALLGAGLATIGLVRRRRA